MAIDWKESQYCNDLIHPSRLKTQEVSVGSTKLGFDNPIVIQSMTNTVTLDTKSSVEQAIIIFDAGADLVRSLETCYHFNKLCFLHFGEGGIG